MADPHQLLLKYIRKEAKGLEIGPSLNPAVTRKEGYNVKTLDHATKAELISKYKHRDTSKIEDVDFVWRGENYRDIIGSEEMFDWIIASHVIEHTTDLVGFLSDCSSLLPIGGVLSLAIPDHRFCFDHFRTKTGLGEIIDANVPGKTRHSLGTITDYFLNVVQNDGRMAWSPAKKDNSYSYCFDREQARGHILKAKRDDDYTDVHSWRFTPSHFHLLMEDLRFLEYTDFGVLECSTTCGHEFFATLEKGLDSRIDRMEMATKALSEI